MGRESLKNILVVDDDRMVRELVGAILTNEGHSTAFAEMASGGKALFSSENGNFDLVITDYRMPGGTGIDLARYLRDVSPATPILMLTSEILQERFIGENIGIVDCIMPKPFDVDQLIKKVEELVGIKSLVNYQVAG